MELELVTMFLAAIMFVCGIVLIFVSKGAWRKFGLALILISIIIFTICFIFWPRAKERAFILLGY